ncbi:SEC-C metal-binding domain-containing protein [Pseudosulfitobacter sp. SM2401]|uniref:SEC-C metal-binding domain-containing protein n=1 Tax=Pseudosulfitobacter sp. SM2401 TaxID=3350098 RepID=UPI0036F2AE14
MDEPPLLRRITALKFYVLAQAARSVVSTGLEAVDDFLVLMADPVGAREIIEQHVLPIVRESQLTELILPTRSVYSIVLAWNGAHNAALAELSALREYAVNDEERQMLNERSAFVSQIISGEARLQRQIPPTGALSRALGSPTPNTVKVGRNEPCTCGSGIKFKKCCGR